MGHPVFGHPHKLVKNYIETRTETGSLQDE